jgi:arginine exporter protein ArgO
LVQRLSTLVEQSVSAKDTLFTPLHLLGLWLLQPLLKHCKSWLWLAAVVAAVILLAAAVLVVS